MKMTRTKLKGLVKECLVEILAEGMDSNLSSLQEKRKHAEGQRLEERRLVENRKKFETRIEDTVSSLTEDSIMQSILADTAKNTLQEQMSHEPRGSGLNAGGTSGIDLGNIFDKTSSNWSKLAFIDKVK